MEGRKTQNVDIDLGPTFIGPSLRKQALCSPSIRLVFAERVTFYEM